MQNFIFSFSLAILAHSNFLLAQDNNKGTENKEPVENLKMTEELSEIFPFQIDHQVKITANYGLQTATYDNSGKDLHCHLMMDPSMFEEGIKTFKIFERGAIHADKIVTEGKSAGRSDIVNAVSSSNVLGLRGGIAKKFQPMGGLKSTGDTSDEEEPVVDNNPISVPSSSNQYQTTTSGKIIPPENYHEDADQIRWKAREKADILSTKVEAAWAQCKIKNEDIDYQTADQLTLEQIFAEDVWIALVRQANSNVETGIVNEQYLLNYWAQADREAIMIAKTQKAEAIQEKERWIARAEADQQIANKETVRQELIKVAEAYQAKTIASIDYIFSSRKLKKTIKVAEEAEKKWSDLACLQKSVMSASPEKKEDQLANDPSSIEKRELAAKKYFKGDNTDWCELTSIERQIYNTTVRIAKAEAERKASAEQEKISKQASIEVKSFQQASEKISQGNQLPQKEEEKDMLWDDDYYFESAVPLQEEKENNNMLWDENSFLMAAESVIEKGENNSLCWSPSSFCMSEKITKKRKTKAHEVKETCKVISAPHCGDDRDKKKTGRKRRNINISLPAEENNQVISSKVENIETITPTTLYKNSCVLSQCIDQYRQPVQASFLENLSLQAAEQFYQEEGSKTKKAGKIAFTASSDYHPTFSSEGSSSSSFCFGIESDDEDDIFDHNTILLRAQEQEKKAREEESNAQLITAQVYRDAAKQNKLACKYGKNAVKARSLEKGGEADSWQYAAQGISRAAAQTLEAIRAEKNKDLKASQSWHEAAQQNWRASEYFVKAVSACIVGKQDEDESWHNAGCALLNTAKQIIKSSEAKTNRKAEIAKDWKEAAQHNQQACEHYIKAAKTYAVEKTDEANSWHGSANALLHAAEQISKVIKAKENETAREIDKDWREAIQHNQQASKHYTKAAKAYAAEKTDEANSWYHAGEALFYAAEQVEKIIRAEASGKEEVAKIWKEAVQYNQEACKFFTNGARAYAERQEAEGVSWNDAGMGLLHAAEQVEKAICAEANGNPEVAIAWKEASEHNQKSSELFTKGIVAYAERGTKEGENWIYAALALRNAAEQAEKAIEAKISGKIEAAMVFKEAGQHQHKSCEYYIKSATAYAAGKINEGKSWCHVGIVLFRASEQEKKAIEAEASGNSEVATGWQAIANNNRVSCEYFIKSAIAYAEKKQDEGKSWYNAALGLLRVSEQEEKAIEAEANGNRESSNIWKEAAKKNQESYEYSARSATEYAEGRAKEGRSLYNTACSLLSIAEKLAAEAAMTRCLINK